jgi:adenylyltransferase/sulfurtransferase
VCGAGGVGSPTLTYILQQRAIGDIGLCDFDATSPSNLNRQILYTLAEIGKQKTQTTKEKLGKFNLDVKVRIYSERLTEDTAGDIFKNYDVLTDGHRQLSKQVFDKYSSL